MSFLQTILNSLLTRHTSKDHDNVPQPRMIKPPNFDDEINELREKPFEYPDWMTEEQFVSAVDDVACQIKRLKQITYDKGILFCTVVAQSGISEWKFILSFNKNGRFHVAYNNNGDLWCYYYIINYNPDSSIPDVVRKRISERILNYYRAYYGE